ncbi:MAG: hypothetical protein HYU86_11100 [Chloroflexi bacterium]|nr:hypothetical protein [Chloroflexota bacterium]
MDKRDPTIVWIVVKVESGIPVCAEAFHHQSSAQEREAQLRAELNVESDEVGLFASITA